MNYEDSLHWDCLKDLSVSTLKFKSKDKSLNVKMLIKIFNWNNILLKMF